MTVPNVNPAVSAVPGIAVEAFPSGVADGNQAPVQVISDTNSGILVGVEPPAVTQRTTATNNANTPAEQPRDDQGRFTTEQVEKIRQQEKDKLYSRLEALNSEVENLRKEREAREAIEAAKAAEEAAKQQKAVEEEMTAKELIAAKEAEWAAKFAEIEKQREADHKLLEMERQYSEILAYKQQALQAAGDSIIPDLADMVNGNNIEEINASIALLQERSARILEGVAAAAQAQRQQMRGVAPTGAAPVGPLDNNPSYETLSAQDIAAMDMNQYAKNRERLLRAASQRDRGLFG